METVVRVTQSPLNPRRWSCDLECGHVVWVTAERRPRGRHEWCAVCWAEVCEAEQTQKDGSSNESKE
jgi:hypothetical protein